MENIISGLVITLLTQGAKRVDAIPVTDEQKGRIRIVVGILSVIGSILTAYLDGTLLTGGVLNVVGGTITNFIYATIAYYGLVR